MQARLFFYLRCAACFRLLPRTRTQKQRAQTHSRRRSYARFGDEKQSTALHWISVFSFFRIYTVAPRSYACVVAAESLCCKCNLKNVCECDCTGCERKRGCCSEVDFRRSGIRKYSVVMHIYLYIKRACPMDRLF